MVAKMKPRYRLRYIHQRIFDCAISVKVTMKFVPMLLFDAINRISCYRK